MKRKNLMKWGLLILAALTIAVWCFTWPGRQMNKNAAVCMGTWTLEREDARCIVTILRRPHVPSVPVKCDCGPDLTAVIIDGETEYHLSIRSHDKQGQLWYDDKRIAVFYIPSWELKTIREMLA